MLPCETQTLNMFKCCAGSTEAGLEKKRAARFIRLLKRTAQKIFDKVILFLDSFHHSIAVSDDRDALLSGGQKGVPRGQCPRGTQLHLSLSRCCELPISRALTVIPGFRAKWMRQPGTSMRCCCINCNSKRRSQKDVHFPLHL